MTMVINVRSNVAAIMVSSYMRHHTEGMAVVDIHASDRLDSPRCG